MDNFSVEYFTVEDEYKLGVPAGWHILDVFGLPYAGPYKREKDAKGQLTRLRKGYTPAARKV